MCLQPTNESKWARELESVSRKKMRGRKTEGDLGRVNMEQWRAFVGLPRDPTTTTINSLKTSPPVTAWWNSNKMVASSRVSPRSEGHTPSLKLKGHIRLFDPNFAWTKIDHSLPPQQVHEHRRLHHNHKHVAS